MKFSKETEEYRREIEKLKAEDHTESKVARVIGGTLKYLAWVVLVLTGLFVVVLLDNTGGYISVPAMFLAFILLFIVPLARLKKKARSRKWYPEWMMVTDTDTDNRYYGQTSSYYLLNYLDIDKQKE